MPIRRTPRNAKPLPKTELRQDPTIKSGGEVAQVEAKNGAEKLAELKPPELPPQVQTAAPAPSTAAHGGVLDIRLGTTQVKRMWNKMQGMLGVGDPGSLRRASEIVHQTRDLEVGLKDIPDEKFSAVMQEKVGDLRASVQSATKELRAEVEGKQAELKGLEKARDPKADELRPEVKKLEVKLRHAELEAIDTHIPEAFSLASEASFRALGMRPFDEQLQAGALLAKGKVVEQYTGEGKTLSAVGPTVLAAMNGRGVHVATSSNYLARRDAELMAPAYNALGLSVSALLPDGTAVRFDPPKGEPTPCDRKDAYGADITYATATQFGFDHLRDNLAKHEDQRVQRGNPTLIMDEVDSLLIDDARTPLIISGQPGEAHADVRTGVSMCVEKLELGEDLEFDRTKNSAYLSDEGFDKLAGLLGLEDEMQLQEQPIASFVDAAIRARALFTKGIDYIVKDDKVELIGKNGEILPGRRLSQGLHQAIEAREGVTINPESRTIGSITLRDYLGLYDRVGGMTGTAEVSEKIFEDVYNLDVVRVPTHRPLLRKDQPPKLFATIEDKAMAIMADALEEAKAGRPVLIGCPDERSVEALSALFAEEGVEHSCLTAKNEAEEAKVIADAGRAGAITISTPKGGRGVDFKLGGEGATAEEKQAVVDQGGLLVLGFAHNESARIDNQLRGRAGRQGEPGETRFYASLEDRFFSNRELPKWVSDRPPGSEGMSSRQVTSLIDSHSELGESLMQGQLKDSLPYDQVNGEQRRRWLEQRESVMKGDVLEGMHGIMEDSLEHLIDRVIDEHGKGPEGQWELYKGLAMMVPLPQRDSAPPEWKGMKPKQLKAHILPQLHESLEKHLGSLGPTVPDSLKQVLLTALDDGFSDHLDELDSIKAGVGWQSIAQKDPKQMYVQFANDAWKDYVGGVQDVVTRAVMGSMPPVELK
jgi:preprotein translocase subunit SecA